MLRMLGRWIVEEWNFEEARFLQFDTIVVCVVPDISKNQCVTSSGPSWAA
jgi:hypothetical protein